jgi:DNA invertase Pin-like site-specific DNA recombinase
MEGKMTDVAIYARLACADPARLEIQISLCREYAIHQDWKLVGTYSDDGASGIRLDRPGLQTLLNDAAEAKFDLVLVEDLDRFARDNCKLVELAQRLRSTGVKVATVAGGEIRWPADGTAEELVRYIFREAAAGVSLQKIAQHLNAFATYGRYSTKE